MAHPMMSAAKSSHARRLKMLGGKSPDKTAYAGADAPYYASGGAVKHEDDKMVEGKKPKMRADRFARGGSVKSKKGTQVNIIIAGKGAPDEQAPKPMMAPPMGMAPPMPPKPPMAPPPGAGGPGGPGMAGLKHGGRAFKRGGVVDEDAAEDKAMMKQMLGKGTGKKMRKMQTTERKKEDRMARKAGGRVMMTAGAGDGEGRLEKAKAAPK